MAITTMPSPALSDAERTALQLIVNKADLVHVDGRAFLVLPIDAETIDTLAAVGVETEDLEPEDDCSYRAEDDDLPPPINVPGDDCDFEPDSYHGGQGANERATWFSINGQVYPGLYPDGRHGYSQGVSSFRGIGEPDPAEGNRAPGWRGGPLAQLPGRTAP